MRIKGASVSDPNKFISCAGSRIKEILSPVVQDDGSIELKKTGEFDLHEYIESFRDQTDMSFIIQQLKLNNPSVLHHGDMFYGDFTEFPKTYAEVLQLNINAKKAFNDLPLDVRKAYEMDFNKWFADFGSDNWNKLMSPSQPIEDVVDESEVKE